MEVSMSVTVGHVRFHVVESVEGRVTVEVTTQSKKSHHILLTGDTLTVPCHLPVSRDAEPL
jgi:hypothetical protein